MQLHVPLYSQEGQGMERQYLAPLAVAAVLGGLGLLTPPHQPTSAQGSDAKRTKQEQAGDGDGFVIIPGSTRRVAVRLKGDVPRNWREKVIKVRTQGGSKTWLLPLFLPKEVSAPTVQPGKPAVFKVTLWDCLEHPGFRQAIKKSLAEDAMIPQWDEAEPVGNKVTVNLYANQKGKMVQLATAQFIREGERQTHPLEFDLSADKAALLAKVGPNNLGLQFKETYIGRYVKDDIDATVGISKTAALAIRNALSKDSAGREATLLVAFGGGVEQKNAVQELFRKEISIQFNRRRDVDITPALLDRIVDKVFEIVAKESEAQTLQEKDVVTFLLGNGLKVTGVIGEFRRMNKEKKGELERRLEKARSWDNQDRTVRDYKLKLDGSFGYGGLSASVSKEFGYRSEDEKKRAGSEEHKSYQRDMHSLAEAVEGKLPVVALNAKQLQLLASVTGAELKIAMGTFVKGQKLLENTLSFESLGTQGPVERGRAAETQLVAQIAAAQQQRTQAVADRDRIAAENTPHEAQLTGLQTQVGEAKKQQTKAEAALAKVLQEIEELLHKYPWNMAPDQSRAALEKSLGVPALRKTLAEKQKVVADWQAAVATQEKNLAPMRAKLGAAKKAVQDGDDKLVKLEAELKALRRLIRSPQNGVKR
jgi:hypothetical protein